MKQVFYLLIFALAATMLFSCGKNEAKKALTEMEQIVEKAEKNKNKLTSEEWKEMAVRFEENEKIVNEAINNDKVGVAAQMKCITLTTRWATAYGPNMLQDMLPKATEPLKNMGDDLNKMLDALKGDTDQEETLESDSIS